MSFTLQVSNQAEADLAKALVWYRVIRPGLEAHLLLCVEEAIDRILENPRAFAVLRPKVQRALIRRFPYAVIFRVRDKRIEIEAFFRGRKDPAR